MTADYKQCTGKQPKLAVGCIRPYIQRVSGVFIRDQNGRRVKLTTHLHLMAKLRLHGAIHHFQKGLYGFMV